MLIREQGRIIKVLRLELNPRTRRKRQIVVGSFQAGTCPPATLLEQLSAAELKELNTWLTAQRQLREYGQMRDVAQRALLPLSEIAHAFDIAAETLSPDQADAIWDEISAIARALKRAGHRRPRPAARSFSAPGQIDFIEMLTGDSARTLA
ncbi:hypothetical protein [Burkholderia anthina]|uniref:hypothetical protein n=1 Tax=Burkholderia anthina TaxID=179879 RepID=UPI00158B2EC5|nr:hypothetical protein [Burkholderia anthina]